ncbi:MAG: hypothetical protein P8J27_08355 [Mariniblastus sp.]|nr:hypothetical protein [Mariniblastus sp.]
MKLYTDRLDELEIYGNSRDNNTPPAKPPTASVLKLRSLRRLGDLFRYPGMFGALLNV